MKRQIIVSIDCEDKLCGECGKDVRPGGSCMWEIDPHNIEGVGTRGPLCLSAEAKLKRLVEAGEGMKRDILKVHHVWEWGAALDALEGKRNTEQRQGCGEE